MTITGPFTQHKFTCWQCQRVTPAKVSTWPLACTEGARKLKEVANLRARKRRA